MSRREIALAALKATLAAALTGADVKRNAAVPCRKRGQVDW